MTLDFQQTIHEVRSLCAGETDEIALMATISCYLYQQIEGFDWVGFYRVIDKDILKIGPYQGGHGCLVIPFEKGICGAAARTGETQDVPNVHERPEHIACSSTTNSEIVVPIKKTTGEVVAVLDVDSDRKAAFSNADKQLVEQICDWLGREYHFVEKAIS